MIFVTTGVVNEFRQATRGEKGVSPTINVLKVFQYLIVMIDLFTGRGGQVV